MDNETWLELGLGVLLVSIFAGIIAVIGGRTSESLRANTRAAKHPPAPGSVSTKRHMNISANSVR